MCLHKWNLSVSIYKIRACVAWIFSYNIHGIEVLRHLSAITKWQEEQDTFLCTFIKVNYLLKSTYG